MCCCKGFSEENEGIDVDLAIPVEDLASIWIDRNINLQSFLPLVSHEVCGLISERGFDVNYLAGVVVVEAFLLKLCLDIRIGAGGLVVLEDELKSWVVASIPAFATLISWVSAFYS
ncbi:RING/U-box superfamily protein [Hibiscus syriacus]|uniref:RING/U-box superfamily protein n=1 Tax=Hibiscus syriacus TaxID=106335 RepID=A0A6A2X7W2_HIBSY|nr:RING/U-box superfamily protein [Hibiscus syriacus]